MLSKQQLLVLLAPVFIFAASSAVHADARQCAETLIKALPVAGSEALYLCDNPTAQAEVSTADRLCPLAGGHLAP